MDTSRLLLALAVVTAFGCSRPTTAPDASGKAPAYDEMLAGRDLDFYRQRVERDPQGATGWAMLSSAYLTVSREWDSGSMAVKAEEAARKSLALRKRRNARAAVALAQALLEQHRFADALGAAKLAASVEPGPGVHRLQAEILLELGRYNEAGMLLKKTPELKKDPAGQALVARWLELHGQTDQALGHLREAQSLVEGNAGTPPAQRAWFHTHLGDALVRAGKAEDAQKEYERATALYPKDHKAFAGLARLAAVRGDWAKCREYAEASLKIAQLTDVEGLLGDAQFALGDRAAAEATYRQIDAENRARRNGVVHAHGAQGKHSHGKGSHTHDRLYAQFLADQGRELPLALHAAEEDLSLRKDVFAWDTVAWAAFRSDDLPKARAAAGKATALGTKDPRLCLHAGLIAARAGDIANAKRLLETAKKGLLMPKEREWMEEALAKMGPR